MKRKRRPSPKPWSKPTGTVNRPPGFCRSATKPCSTRSGSTELPKQKGTTNSRQGRRLLSKKQQSNYRPTARRGPFCSHVHLRSYGTDNVMVWLLVSLPDVAVTVMV